LLRIAINKVEFGLSKQLIDNGMKCGIILGSFSDDRGYLCLPVINKN
jgi:hypothetical protein